MRVRVRVRGEGEGGNSTILPDTIASDLFLLKPSDHTEDKIWLQYW